jgi:methylenetetrahydrofolate reductase (NADPH)
MHIKDKLAAAEATGRTGISFEFFPPKTVQGVQNLYERMDRMHGLGPSFIDVTWGAGGRLSELTTEMVKAAQSTLGFETCMHLTCTDMPQGKVDEALKNAYKAGCTNILALRGDPPRDKEEWVPVDGGFRYAKDLVVYIRSKYGNHFDIGVAGYPEGCEDEEDPVILMKHLKEKVDAGATFIITQMFYDADHFLDWVRRCREAGITVPILPGIMPISTYAAFMRRCNWVKCKVPPDWLEALEPVKNDDAAVKQIGKRLVADMCRKLLAGGIFHLHL